MTSLGWEAGDGSGSAEPDMLDTSIVYEASSAKDPR
jgi:hypothetical protein